ncbi:hypothetical protein AGMMS49543_22780 [Betaproteobacteria bacterium]|nr:hypothetical protein AGMMS49543_22780 [Betaproteobacteria bacterium]GHU20264.1 hypothetical protein AGMMS50243_14380 [Betaproteobacteria bacterium]
MSLTVAAIVEGYGEVKALPLLLRNLATWKTPDIYPNILEPIRVQKDRFLNKDSEFFRHLTLAKNKCGDDGLVLILLDADDACPAKRGTEILRRASEYLQHQRVSVVLANREYEAWFIAAARSLDGKRGFSLGSADIVDAEKPRDAKGWIEKHMGGKSYDPVLDQPAFSAMMDLQQAFDRSRSFRKLCSEWDKQVRS